MVVDQDLVRQCFWTSSGSGGGDVDDDGMMGDPREVFGLLPVGEDIVESGDPDEERSGIVQAAKRRATVFLESIVEAGFRRAHDEAVRNEEARMRNMEQKAAYMLRCCRCTIGC